MINFFLGRYRVDMSYDDSLLSVVVHNLTSPWAFWSPSTHRFLMGKAEQGGGEGCCN